ncbi:MAG: DMT family transporter, partial [Gammaproteobacteria bacterium]|nr:DMT family transporter [Gammaproteobacteria bacterium]
LGVFQIALAYLLVTDGIRHVPALEVSLLLLVEPVLSPVWAWLFLDEVPGRLALAGGAIVIAATVLYPHRRYRTT